MNADLQLLREAQPRHAFFVGLDSDGCVFDTMELKHKECFVPKFIQHFQLQPVSKFARETWEFVNLYSHTRGINRFPALSNALNLLAERPQVRARGVRPWPTDALDEWLARETRLSQETIEGEIAAGNHALEPVLAWSRAVNQAIAELVLGVPPFGWVRESLQRLSERADLMVVSQTPAAALANEWAEHDLAQYPRLIAGQEYGSKTEHLRQATAGKYAPRHVLMIGDAPGDFKAARSNHALFYPIVPGYEEICWERFAGEALDLFLEDRYAGAYETALIEEFNAHLPEQPTWQTA
ncbi:MAG: HAD family hydrolase [Verrucomicrobia bacterium]|nr:HAD family hydrolase [Verrucomicrobiota bacterium]